MLSKLTSRHVAMIVIGLCALLGVLWYSTIYSGTQASIQTLQTEIGDPNAPDPTSLLGQKRTGETARANVTQLCATVANLQAEQTAFFQKLPPTEQLARLLTELSDKIAASGAQLNSITRSAGGGSTANLPAGVRSVGLNMAIEGSWGAMRKVLASVEEMQRFSKVDTVNLTMGGEAKTFDPKLTAQMAVTTYIYDTPANAAAQTANPLCQSTSSLPGVTR